VRRFYFATGGAVDQAGNYSWGTAQFLLPYVIGTYSTLTGRCTAWPSILEHCEIFVAFGGLALKNGQVSSGGAAEHTQEVWLRQLAARGIPVVNVSPTRGDCPDFLRAEWLPIRPNTDTALMLALAHEAIIAGKHDKSFLAGYCIGFEVLEAYILGRSDGIAKSPAWAAPITGIEERRIVDLARRLAGKRSYLTCSFSIQRAHRGEQPYWMAIALAAILGQIGLPGGGFGFGHGSMNGVVNPRPATPGPELPVPDNPLALSIPVARIADMLLNPGAEYRFDGATHVYPDIRLVHWAGGNPFHHHQQLNRFLSAWQRPETIVVNEIWWTPTARYADIVLPATTFWERNDVHTPWAGAGHYAIFMRQAIEPVGECRNDIDICAALAARLGIEGYNDKTEDEWLRELTRNTIDDFETFKARGLARLPAPEDAVAFAREIRDPERHPFSTPSGKIEIYSMAIAARPDPYGLGEISSIPTWIPEPVDPRHPLRLVTPKSRARTHSMHDNQPVLSRADRDDVWMHPADAAARGIVDGQRVAVFNDRGRTLIPVRVTDRVAPGVVSIKEGAWFALDERGQDTRGCSNLLTPDCSSPAGATPFNSCFVEIEVPS